MERRQHPRIETNTPVQMTILAGDGPPVGAVLEQISGAGARVRSPVSLAPGTALRLDLPDTLLLGECVHCEPAPQGFTVGIHLEHALNTVGELRRLMSALMAEAPGRNARASNLR